METTTTTLDSIKSLSPYALARLVECGDPDSPESRGALFLTSVRDAVVEYAETDDYTHHWSDAIHEIADSAPDVYTHQRWQEFVDLCAYETDLSDIVSTVTFSDNKITLTDIAGYVLFDIAERLAIALVSLMVEARITTWERYGEE